VRVLCRCVFVVTEKESLCVCVACLNVADNALVCECVRCVCVRCVCVHDVWGRG